MRLVKCLSAILLFRGLSAALPSETFLSHIEHERREDYAVWEKRAKVSTHFEVPVKIALAQSNEDKGHEALLEISDPTSSRYGQHFTSVEVDEFFAPHAGTIKSVKSWLMSGDIAEDRLHMTPNRQWVTFNAKIGELESLLKTQFFLFKHRDSGNIGLACDVYHLPSEIAPLVDFITPGIHVLATKALTNYKSLGKRLTRSAKPPMKPSEGSSQHQILKPPAKTCSRAITPECIRKMYGVPKSYNSNVKSKIGFYEFGQSLYQPDLDHFFEFVRPDMPNGTHPIIHSIDGGQATTSTRGFAGLEGELDVEMSYGLLNPGDLVYFPTDDYPTTTLGKGRTKFTGMFNNFLDGIDGSYCNYSAFGETGNDPHIDPTYPDPDKGGYKGKLQCGVWAATKVISISYGPREYEWPVKYTRRQCSEFMKLAMQGVTIVTSSGDTGVATQYGAADNGCLGKFSDTIFSPQLPATCPYVLAVGATALPPNTKPRAHKEVASLDFPTGGGFSNIFPRPNYQNKAVKTYLENNVPDYPFYETKYNKSVGAGGGIYNRAGRGYPDVSAVGNKIFVVIAGESGGEYLSGGTSASAPLWASLLTRINAARLNANKSTVGFVHPVLYQHPEVFHDITVGSNPGCQTKGFHASKGWDRKFGFIQYNINRIN